MNTTISFLPETLGVEEKLIGEIMCAAEVVGEIYGVENSELSLTLTDDEREEHFIGAEYRNVRRINDHDNKIGA